VFFRQSTLIVVFIPVFFRQSSLIVVFIQNYQQQSNPEAREGKQFELKAKFPPQDLLPSINESISSCGLSGEAINVLWK
jgi:hypothetical protein